MSRKSIVITVEPPSYKTDTEKIEISGVVCPYCSGCGGWSEQVGRDQFVDHICNVCKGKKKIKAVITVDWIPDE